MEKQTNVLTYNNLTMIMLNLNESVALISDFENWNEFEDDLIKELILKSEELKVDSTIIFFKSSEQSNGIFSEDDIIEFAKKNKINQVIFYIINNFIDQMSESDLYKNINGFLNIKYIIVSEYFNLPNLNTFSSDFFKINWKEKCFLTNNYNKKPTNDSLIKLLNDSEFDLFKDEVGIKYNFFGRVQHGKKLGRTIGFPTINLKIENKSFPLIFATYIVEVYIIHNKTTHIGAGCFWENESNEKVFEITLLNFNEEIYDYLVKITPIQFIRHNKKPKNLEDLKKMIEGDVQICEEYLKSLQ